MAAPRGGAGSRPQLDSSARASRVVPEVRALTLEGRMTKSFVFSEQIYDNDQ